jgi:clan AA aspartic protease (TIGR02281 family)
VIVALAALAVATACEAGENPFAPLPADATAVDKLVRASLFGDPKADPALEAWLKANPSGPAAERNKAYHRLCNDYGIHSQTEPALKACTDGLALEPQLAGNLAIVAALKGAGPLTASGSARVPLTWNPQGSQSVDITVGGVTVPWIVDTGAEISVVTTSNAKAMGVMMAKGDFTVGSTTADVQGGIGLIEEMKIGAATVRNVPVLVLPDKQLSIAGLPTIPAILGLPVMTAFKRVGWIDGGTVLALGSAAPAVPANAPKLYWHEEGVGISLKTAAGEQGAHLDSGANRTDLRPPGLGLLSEAEKAAGFTRVAKTGGAGGLVERQEQHFPQVAFAIAGAPIVLKDIAVNSANTEGAGRIGMDAVIQLDEFVLDLEHMRVVARPWTGAPRIQPKPAIAAAP